MTELPETRLSRFFPAPPALVFQAWSSAEHIRNWFCPTGYSVPQAKVDLAVGGAFEVCMRSPGGVEHWSRGHFTEVVPPDWLVIEMTVTDAGEKRFFTATTEVRFVAEGFGTRLEVRQSYRLHDPAGLQMIGGASLGWQQTLDRLSGEVTRIAQDVPAAHGMFRIDRRYDVAIADLWRAFTDQGAKSAWFAAPPDQCSDVERSIDVRVGGKEQLRCHWKSGLITDFQAIYHDVLPERRLVYSYEMFLDGRKISVSLATIEMAPQEAGSRLTVTEQGVFLNGYEDQGSRERGTIDLLDRMAATLLQ